MRIDNLRIRSCLPADRSQPVTAQGSPLFRFEGGAEVGGRVMVGKQGIPFFSGDISLIVH